MSAPCVPLSPPYRLETPSEAPGEPSNTNTESTSPGSIPEERLQALVEQGYTRSLARSLEENKLSFALRIWIVDNSGSMQTPDGHRLVVVAATNTHTRRRRENRSLQLVPCTRWEELASTIEYHAQLADLIQAPTRFRFLNHPGAHIGPRSFGVGGEYAGATSDGLDASSSSSSSYPQLGVDQILQILSTAQPLGCTPLCLHIAEIRKEICEMAPALRALGQRVVVVIATDGLPTDAVGCGGHQQQTEFVESLRSLEGLPIWLVIRLCTDESHVTEFYNNLDSELELSIDVLDDFMGEAEEVHKVNPWLNYGLPLHRMREMGYQERLFDLIDERPFTPSEVHDFCGLLFTGRKQKDSIPDPSFDWGDFCSCLKQLLTKESKQWNPIKRAAMPWIDLQRLCRIHDRRARSLFPPLWLIVLLICLLIAGQESILRSWKNIFG